MERVDDFDKRREHLKDLSDEDLKNRFWKLAEELVDPLLVLGKENTSPSIERSVLMRMGFSSLEASAIADRSIDYGLISKGAGHLVYKLSKEKNMKIREAGLALIEGEYWDYLVKSFEGSSK